METGETILPVTGSELESLRLRVARLEAERARQDAVLARVSREALLLGAVREAVIATDLDGRVTYWGAAAERLYGWSAGEAIGRHLLELMTPAGDDGALAATLDRALAEGAVTEELPVRRRDGATLCVRATTSPLRDGDGTLIGYVGVASDVTESRRAEEALRRSEDRFRVAVKNAAFVPAEVDRELRYRWIYNPHPDFDPGSVIGKRDDELEDSEGIRQLVALKQRVLDSGSGAREVIDFHRSDGVHTYDIVAEPLRDEAGAVVGVATAAFDVTERARYLRQAEQANRDLARERALFEAVLRQMPSGVIIAEAPTGRLILGNEQAERIWRHSYVASPSIAGYDSYKGFHRDGTPYRPEEWPLARAIATGETVIGEEMDFEAGDGSRRTMRVSACPVRDGSGAVIAAVVVFLDITDTRHLEEERGKVNKLESLGVLAGGIAHDFNNLLTGVLGNITLARFEAEDKPEAVQVLADAEKAAVRAKGLTMQLLTFAKGGAPLRRPTDLAEIIADAATFALRGRSSRLRLDIPADLWAANVDAGQIGQVVQNLVINADEAMPQSGTIAVRAEDVEVGPDRPLPLPPGRYVCFSVRDQGTGIGRDNLARVFDPYYTTKPGGSGIGLAVVYSIVTKHDGYVTVDSELGRGATFRVYLPAAAIEPAVPTAARGEPVARKGKVLVMDDEEVVRNVARRMLARLGYDVEVAHEGAEAAAMYGEALARGRPFVAVIVDAHVAVGLGGLETLARLQALDPGVRAIVSSGYANHPVMSNHADYGFAAAIDKPYRLEELSAALERALA